ncbi:Phosphoglucosamine mutase [Marinomonas aquimarina]|uniref:Phosphoglucosamine mutase n=1 Tax=Marinomonas aquimarina TaxID=295068 RepID=A0A1A8T4G9_9GAMM|nr:phosphomannomutase [Marinomonas aquimarina]SBS25753.1 Phosphoglucosamine mutase [Marinomonas aquimarina]
MSDAKTPLALCANKDVKFGTSGVRGPVAELSKSLCQGFTQAFLSTLCRADSVCLGVDLRPSSPQLAKWVSEQAQEMGVNVLDCGPLPTPALALYAMQQGLPAIMITGSHIPFDRNGMKFYLPTGEISKADEQAILTSRLDSCANKRLRGGSQDCAERASQHYQQRYYDAFPTLNLGNKRIGVYQHSSVTRDLLTEVLRHFGAEVIELGRSDHFVALDTEAVGDTEQALAQQWTQQYRLDAIVTTDGDGDRPLIADEAGQWLRGDQVGMLTCHALQATHIATPINSNSGLEHFIPAAKVVRTKIGSPYVIEAMQQATEQDNSLGFEANGGVLLGRNHHRLTSLPTRDALLPILCVLSTLANQPLSSLSNILPKRYSASSRIQNVDQEICRQLLENLVAPDAWPALLAAIQPCHALQIATINTLDGVRATLTNGDILHLRASGNANELRIYSESNTIQRANQVCSNTEIHISSLFFDV